MVRDHLKQLQAHQYPEIARQMNLTLDEVSHHLEIIQRLDPKPGMKHSPNRSTYVVPDVFVVKEGDEYRVVLNDDGLPRLRISPTYKRMLDDKEGNAEETRTYVREKLRSALWLLKSVDQRQRTIYKVTESIVRHQRGFLDHGIAHLRPLVLRDVASDIGMHESTVSRVVANKYVHTPRGVYELRFFFHSGITSTMGEAVSSVTIKDRIRKMIDTEDQTPAALGRADRRDPGAGRAAAGPPHGGQVPRGAPHPSLQPSQVGPLTPGGAKAPPILEVGSCRSSTRAVRPKCRQRSRRWPSGSCGSWSASWAASPTCTWSWPRTSIDRAPR